MEIVKETEDYQIVKKRSGRYGIRKRDRSWITGDEKVKILVTEGLVKLSKPAAKPDPEPEDAPADEETAVEGTVEEGVDEATEASPADDDDSEG